MGIIEPSDAPYVSPLVLVKKPDGTFRICVNLKDLNKNHCVRSRINDVS